MKAHFMNPVPDGAAAIRAPQYPRQKSRGVLGVPADFADHGGDLFRD
jgi:hypothetical protein